MINRTAKKSKIPSFGSLAMMIVFLLSSSISACSGTAADHISTGIKCMESPLADYCAPLKLDKNMLRMDNIDRLSTESLIKSTAFVNKYSAVFFGIAPEKKDCSQSDYDLESIPTAGNFYKIPEGTYKLCVKYYLSGNKYSYKASEPIKVVSHRKKLKNTDSWFVKEIRKRNSARSLSH